MERSPNNKPSIPPEVSAAASLMGRRGGIRVKELYGSDYFSDIGAKGAASRREELGEAAYKQWFTEIGRKGGDARRGDVTRLSAAAKIGGAATKLKMAGDPDYFKNLGKK